ncbi:antibiotic biosynthesis monooxygenase [Sphingobium sp. DEHP117]|uniref:putative quinol monooxygenase n=1 Tax=Sphingobium sp. DEHP117 TaxID=2993436 RepID=UPI0027D54DCB|nr:antibiotic biosynthesis monooxygenase [Sphingobium sp. DEHP117]MDQ4419257.1 antibiotic biosynthesis monooxygenase [Sphingobium sp. DEHP117]
MTGIGTCISMQWAAVNDQVREYRRVDGIRVTFLIKIKPSAADAFCDNLPEMIKETAKRPGFGDLHIVRHSTEPGTILFIETWDSEQSYHDYIAWRTSRGDMDGMNEILVEPPRLDFWPTTVALA